MHVQTVSRCARALLVSCVCGAAFFDRPLSAGTIWTEDFGTGTGTFTSGESTSFLPTPAAGGGTARVRVGSGGGGFALVNPGAGSSSLVATASSTTSVNKFSIYDFAGTGLFTLEADLSFSGADSGSWYLLVGNGARFSDNTTFATNEVFAGLRWDFGSGGALATTRLSTSGSWLTTNVPSMAQDTNYHLKIYANNTAAAVEHAGLSLAPGTWDVFVDGVLVSSDLAKAGLADDVAIDSFMFNGAGSTGNAATLTVNSVSYANVLAPEPEGWMLAAIAAASLGAAGYRRRRLFFRSRQAA